MSLGKGVAEDVAAHLAAAPAPVPAQTMVSRGMTRGKLQGQNLMLVQGGPHAQFNPVGSIQQSTVTALKSTTAYKPEPGVAPAAFNAEEADPVLPAPGQTTATPRPGTDAGLLLGSMQQLQLDADEGVGSLHGLRGLVMTTGCS